MVGGTLASPPTRTVAAIASSILTINADRRAILLFLFRLRRHFRQRAHYGVGRRLAFVGTSFARGCNEQL
jgi:hypothetical protein